MKKILLIILLFIISIITTFAYKLTNKDYNFVNILDKKIFHLIDTKPEFTAKNVSNIIVKYAYGKAKSERIKKILLKINEDIELKYGIDKNIGVFENNDIENLTSINKPRIRFIVLDTSDITVTQNHIKRLQNIGEYIEKFFTKELTEKGYKLKNTNIFARNTDGDILIYTVKSTQSSANIDKITTTGIQLAKKQYPDLTDLNSIWAIIHFKENGGFLGGGKVNNGSMRFQLKNSTGNIDFNSNMSETYYHRNISLKAIIHELGHALTLLHNGPLKNNKSFNTLMGPINKSYEKIANIKQTKNVKLSNYSASIIAYHPIFRNTYFDISELEGKKIKIEKIMGDKDLFTLNCLTGIAHIRGKVSSNLPFHNVVVRFSYDNLQGKGYWNKSFAITPDSNGIFDLKLTKNNINIGSLSKNDFKYELMVAFNNGLTTGVKQLNSNERITLSKNKYIEDYTFNAKSNKCN